eukprot:3435534-Amphidinium_carterae.1
MATEIIYRKALQITDCCVTVAFSCPRPAAWVTDCYTSTAYLHRMYNWSSLTIARTGVRPSTSDLQRLNADKEDLHQETLAEPTSEVGPANIARSSQKTSKPDATSRKTRLKINENRLCHRMQARPSKRKRSKKNSIPNSIWLGPMTSCEHTFSQATRTVPSSLTA